MSRSPRPVNFDTYDAYVSRFDTLTHIDAKEFRVNYHMSWSETDKIVRLFVENNDMVDIHVGSYVLNYRPGMYDKNDRNCVHVRSKDKMQRLTDINEAAV